MVEGAFAQRLLQDTGFRRMTDLWTRRYQKLWHSGGTIYIKDPEDDEREAIGGLFGKDYWGVRDISIPHSVWEKAIEDSRFAESDLLRVLETHKGESILTNKEQKEIKAQKKQ